MLRKRPYIKREWCRDVLAAPCGVRSRPMVAFASGGGLWCQVTPDLDFFGLLH